MKSKPVHKNNSVKKKFGTPVLWMIAGIGLATLGFYFGFRHIPLDAIVLALSEFDYFWIIPSVVLAVISFALRTIRWQLIVQPVLKIRFLRGFIHCSQGSWSIASSLHGSGRWSGRRCCIENIRFLF